MVNNRKQTAQERYEQVRAEKARKKEALRARAVRAEVWNSGADTFGGLIGSWRLQVFDKDDVVVFDMATSRGYAIEQAKSRAGLTDAQITFPSKENKTEPAGSDCRYC